MNLKKYLLVLFTSAIMIQPTIAMKTNVKDSKSEQSGILTVNKDHEKLTIKATNYETLKGYVEKTDLNEIQQLEIIFHSNDSQNCDINILQKISNLNNLEELTIQNLTIEDEGLEKIFNGKLENLTNLNLLDNGINEYNIDSIYKFIENGSLKNLTSLKIRDKKGFLDNIDNSREELSKCIQGRELIITLEDY